MTENYFKNFELVKTADGSPSLRLLGLPQGELMHHSHGAAAETKYIYTKALKLALNELNRDKINSLIVGLGLGYIEVSITDECPIEKKGITLSFESDEQLKDYFISWFMKKPFQAQFIYDKMGLSILEKKTLDNIKSDLLNDYNQKRLILNGNLTLESSSNEKYNLICFDAFSRQTSKDLWTEDFLDQFILKFCDQFCVFSTYACTGSLNRMLKKNKFQIVKISGFSNKRESTLAIRK